MVKNPPAKTGDTGFDPWVRKILWKSKWQPTPVFLPGKSCRLRILAGYSPQGCKESDMTEHEHSQSNYKYNKIEYDSRDFFAISLKYSRISITNKQTNQEMDRRSKQTFLQRSHINCQQAHEKMLRSTN